MEKNKTEIPKKEKVDYHLSMLLNDIQDDLVGSDEDDKKDEKKGREHQHKLIVMQMLLTLAGSFGKDYYDDDDKLINAIDVKVSGDELLSGYLFFVSQNPHFDYSWNYMRKRKNNYKVFLVDALRFINNVVIDINMIAGKPRMGNDVHVVFNDVFDVELTNEAPFVKAQLLWENFNCITSLKKSYTISVKSNGSVLIAGNRKELSDAVNLIDKALDMVGKARSISE